MPVSASRCPRPEVIVTAGLSVHPRSGETWGFPSLGLPRSDPRENGDLLCCLHVAVWGVCQPVSPVRVIEAAPCRVAALAPCSAQEGCAPATEGEGREEVGVIPSPAL